MARNLVSSGMVLGYWAGRGATCLMRKKNSKENQARAPPYRLGTFQLQTSNSYLSLYQPLNFTNP